MLWRYSLRKGAMRFGLAARALGAAGITVYKNTVPGETQSPFVTSGIRIGTPALTTRGMGEGEMRRIAALIDRVLSPGADEETYARVRAEVRALVEPFPLFAGNEQPAARL
jgi:glycine hydroxymethyltransferase